MKRITIAIIALLAPLAQSTEESESTDYWEHETETQMLLLEAERLLGEFIDSPKTIADYLKFLPDSEGLGWCCTTSSGDYPFEVRTYDFHSPYPIATPLQFEFLMGKEYGIKHKEMKIYAARLFCTVEGTGMRFYLGRGGYGFYDHLKTKEEKNISNQAVDTTAANARLSDNDPPRSTSPDVEAMAEAAVVSP